MTYLLDTHALLWALAEPDRLGDAARRILIDRSSELLVSSASAWEIATKHRLGKLPGADLVIDEWDAHLARLGASALPISSRHALVAGSLVWEHRDPFDRMLAAQAVIENATLVTRDPIFAALPGIRARW